MWPRLGGGVAKIRERGCWGGVAKIGGGVLERCGQDKGVWCEVVKLLKVTVA